ncbi:hypothetical protein K501DRAFT_207950 [Backusella circina FSU 941]|nr:hypothetical protein K501DRAFT_207950 [Backusella circina FSU 941]
MTRGKQVIPNDRQSEYLFTEQQISDSEGSNLVVRTQAAFISKLYKMLEDTSIQHLISWSEKGDLFSVSNPTSFSKIVLPQYFKHNNWQSFVRQLNMYGFHKVNDMIHLNLTSDTQTWEFKHPHFKRGEVDDLQNIKRKSTKQQLAPTGMVPQLPLDNQNEDYNSVQKHILHLEERLHSVSRSYDALRNETTALKTVQLRQQELINDLTILLTNIIEENMSNDLSDSEKNTILSKLSNVQSLLFSVSPGPPSVSSVRHDEFHSDMPIISPPCGSTRSSYSSSDSVRPYNSPSNNTVNQRMGLGKESHLLNPEPSAMERDGHDAYEYKRKRL